MNIAQTALEGERSCLDAKISCFNGSTDATPIKTATLAEVLDEIRADMHRKRIETLRQILATKGRDAYDKAKKKLFAVTFGGPFTRRGNDHMVQHSGLVHGDLDGLADVQVIKRRLCRDQYVAYCFVSPSGAGLKLGVRILQPVTDDAAYKVAWQQIADYYADHYEVIWDEACQDIARLCYMSWDPELYVNSDATPFRVKESPVVTPAPATSPLQPPRQPRPLTADALDRDAQQAIQTAVELIDHSIPPSNGRPGTRHENRLKASELLGGYIAGSFLSHDQAYTALEVAVARNTDDFTRSMKTIRDGLQHGQSRPITPEQRAADRQAWLARNGHTSNGTTQATVLDDDDLEAKAEAARRQAEAEDETFRKSNPLRWLQTSKAFREVPLAGVRKLGLTNATYELILTDGRSFTLGSAAKVLTSRAVQAAIIEVLPGVAIPKLSEAKWRRYAAALTAVAGLGEDIGTDDQTETREWLQAFIAGYSRGNAIDRKDLEKRAYAAAMIKNLRPGKSGRCYVWDEEHTLYLRLNDLLQHLGIHHGMRITSAELKTRLRSIGFQPRVLQVWHDNKNVQARVWASPARFHPNEGEEE